MAAKKAAATGGRPSTNLTVTSQIRVKALELAIQSTITGRNDDRAKSLIEAAREYESYIADKG